MMGRSDKTLTSDSLGPSASSLVITLHTHLGWRKEEKQKVRGGESEASEGGDRKSQRREGKEWREKKKHSE